MTLRTERLAGLIQQEIAAMLLRGEIKDPRLPALVSISAVEVTRDLQIATVFFSVLGEGDEAKGCLAALSHAAGFIRGQLGRRLRVRFTPELRFRVDESFVRSDRIHRLISSLDIPPAETEPPEPSAGGADQEGRD